VNAAPDNQSGVASGVNNAISRVAGLIAIAVFGLILSSIFNLSLDTHLAQLGLSPALQHQADQQRALLGAAVSPDPRVTLAVREAFVLGYRVVVLVAAGLALASAISARIFLEGRVLNPQNQGFAADAPERRGS